MSGFLGDEHTVVTGPRGTGCCSLEQRELRADQIISHTPTSARCLNLRREQTAGEPFPRMLRRKSAVHTPTGIGCPQMSKFFCFFFTFTRKHWIKTPQFVLCGYSTAIICLFGNIILWLFIKINGLLSGWRENREESKFLFLLKLTLLVILYKKYTNTCRYFYSNDNLTR